MNPYLFIGLLIIAAELIALAWLLGTEDWE